MPSAELVRMHCDKRKKSVAVLPLTDSGYGYLNCNLLVVISSVFAYNDTGSNIIRIVTSEFIENNFPSTEFVCDR